MRILRRARSVAVYLARGSEFPTTALIRALRRHRCAIFVPIVADRTTLHFHRLPVSQRNGLAIASARRCAVSRMDVVVTPLLAFDCKGVRLGQGGGYYDRALAGRRYLKRPLRVGYAWSGQQMPTLPSEPWDLPLRIAVTERGAHFLLAR